MTAKSLDLVDAVVLRLNTASFTESFTAEKDLLPINRIEDIDALEVKVLAGPETWEKQDRGNTFLVEYDVLVSIQCSLSTETDIDVLLLAVEEIKADLAKQKMAGLPMVGVEQDQPFDAELAYNSNVFYAVTTFKYRGFK